MKKLLTILFLLPFFAFGQTTPITLQPKSPGTNPIWWIPYTYTGKPDGMGNFPDTKASALYLTMAQLRTISGALPTNNFFIMDAGKEGVFKFDPADELSADNGATIIVTAGGRRVKRVITNFALSSWFGMVGDGSDETTKFQTAITTAASLHVPLQVTQPASFYYVTAALNVTTSIISDNLVAIHVPYGYIKLFTITPGTNNITIRGMNATFTTTGSGGTNAPMFTEFAGNSNITIERNITNGRINASNTLEDYYRDVTIQNNIIVADFSNYSSSSVQNDMIYMYNIHNLKILNNRLDIVNSNRVIKISSGTETSMTANPQRTIIMGNRIKSTNSSDKQCIDMYQQTEDVIIQNNFFDCTGHNSIIENKTTQSRTYATNLSVIGNKFKTDGTPVRLFGTYGSNTGNQSGFQNVDIADNQFDSYATTTIQVAHYHSVDIHNNTFNRSNGFQQAHVSLSGLKVGKFTENIMFGGGITISDVGTVGTETYNPTFDLMSIENNYINGDIATSTSALVTFSNLAGITSIKVKNNDIVSNTVPTGKPINMSTVVVTSLVISGNTFNDAITNGVRMSGVTATTYKAYNNSWSDATNQVLVSIAAGTTSPYVYTYDGRYGANPLVYIQQVLGSNNFRDRPDIQVDVTPTAITVTGDLSTENLQLIVKP